jgi:hypothetical protein
VARVLQGRGLKTKFPSRKSTSLLGYRTHTNSITGVRRMKIGVYYHCKLLRNMIFLKIEGVISLFLTLILAARAGKKLPNV